jgi:hypothetical protein
LLSLICFKEEKNQGAIRILLVALFSKITSKGKDALPVPLCLAINNQLEHLLEIELNCRTNSEHFPSIWNINSALRTGSFHCRF